MKTAKEIAQWVVILGLLGASAWLGQTWRREGVEFETSKDLEGGIQKQKLISEAEKYKAQVIAQFEARAQAERGSILGGAEADGAVLVETGKTDKDKKLNAATRSQRYAVDTINGINAAVERFKQTALDNSDFTSTSIAVYLIAAAKADQETHSLIWKPTTLTCSGLSDAAKYAALRLEQTSPLRGF